MIWDALYVLNFLIFVEYDIFQLLKFRPEFQLKKYILNNPRFSRQGDIVEKPQILIPISLQHNVRSSRLQTLNYVKSLIN